MSEVVYDYKGSPSTVLRCQEIDSDRTVIVKRSNTANDSLRFDAAGLRLVNELAPGIAPALYGMDTSAAVLVLEDLSPSAGALLGNILFGDDTALAEAALMEFQRALARLHLATMGHENRYRQILTEHGNPGQRSRHRVKYLPECLQALPERLAQINIVFSEEARQELEETVHLISQPGKFTAFVHGDATLANAFYVDGRIRFFDFEASAYRHCLIDGSFARLRYLHSVWARKIPLELQQRMMAVYRETFLAGSDIKAAEFDRHLAACCAGWLAALCTDLPEAIQQDRKWGRATMRQRIIAALEHFVTLSDELSVFPHLRDVCQTSETRLRSVWPVEDCSIRWYPAVGSEGTL